MVLGGAALTSAFCPDIYHTFFTAPALCLRNPSLLHRPQSRHVTLLHRKSVTTSQQQTARPCPHDHGPWARLLLASCRLPVLLHSIHICVGPPWLLNSRGRRQPSGDSVPGLYKLVSASEDYNRCREGHQERQPSTLVKPWSPGARQRWAEPRVCFFPVM